MIRVRRRWRLALLYVAALALGACSSPPTGELSPQAGPATAPSAAASAQLGTAPSPRPTPTSPIPQHIVVVIFENKGAQQIIGSGQAPEFDRLAAQGVLYTRSHAVTHPSQPNYLALFSGSTQGVAGDACPYRFSTPNLARQLLSAGRTFVGYAEGLPQGDIAACSSGGYARKHAPWINFANVPTSVSQPFSAFPSDFTKLPSVAFVVPDLCHDMHDCSVPTGDQWLAGHMARYAAWARTHHSLLVVTFDEDDFTAANLITTFVVGQGVTPARSSAYIDHYTVLRTIEACFGLPPLGAAAGRRPLPQICR